MSFKCLLVRVLYWGAFPLRWFIDEIGEAERFIITILLIVWAFAAHAVHSITGAAWWLSIVTPLLFVACVVGACVLIVILWTGLCEVWDRFSSWLERAYDQCTRKEEDPR